MHLNLLILKNNYFKVIKRYTVYIEVAILGFHVTSPNSTIQNWEAYKIFTFIQGKIT